MKPKRPPYPGGIPQQKKRSRWDIYKYKRSKTTFCLNVVNLLKMCGQEMSAPSWSTHNI